LTEPRYLLDVNVLLALSDCDHVSHPLASGWFARIGNARFQLCAITESGFVRLASSPLLGNRNVPDAMALLRQLGEFPNCGYLPIQRPWLQLVAPFASRLHGYRQVTDALLLGLAIESGAILVTLDRRIEALAGSEFRENLLVLGYA
jgi:hypothetical protein